LLDHFFLTNAKKPKKKRYDQKEERIWLKNEYDELKEQLAVRLE
jgi:hypothetical protein